MNSELFRKAGLLVAGPASGKTTLRNHLTSVSGGIVVHDHDVILAAVFRQLKESIGPDSVSGPIWFPDFMTHVVNFTKASVNGGDLVVADYLSNEFIDQLIGHGSPMIYVGRPSVDAIMRHCKTGLSRFVAEKRVAFAECYAPRKFDFCVWLPDDVFLQDVVTIRNKSWVLTPLGEVLSRLSLTQVLLMGNWADERPELGGSNG